MPGAVAVVHDERCGVTGELFHQTLYGGTVGERDIVAAQGLKNEAMAILLNGIECHGASFAAVRVQMSLYKVLVYPHVAHRGVPHLDLHLCTTKTDVAQMSAPWTSEWYHSAVNGRFLAANGAHFGGAQPCTEYVVNPDKTFAQLGSMNAPQGSSGIEKRFIIIGFR